MNGNLLRTMQMLFYRIMKGLICSLFPDFLFPDDVIGKIKNIRLTADEQELLGLETIYGSAKCNYDNESDNLPALPYEYVRRVGAFHIIGLNDSLSNKICGFRGSPPWERC